MAGKKIIAIILSGGEFEPDNDGELSYKGGEAHAMEIDDQMKYKDFRLEVSEMFNCNLSTMLVKYFLPGNKKTLITISNEKDLKRMVKFHANSNSAELYVMIDEVVAPDVSNVSASRSSRTTLSEAEPPVEAPLCVASEGVAADGTVGEGGVGEAVVDGGVGEAVVDGGAGEAVVDGGVVDVCMVDGGVVDGAMVDGALIDGVVVDSGVGDDVVVGGMTDTSQPTDMIDASYSIIDDTGHIDGHMDISAEMQPPPIHALTVVENHIRPSIQWQSNITGVGQRFNSVHEFREALRKFAIANQFAFKYKKNDSHRVTVKCKAEGCPWRIHASRLSTTQLICIKRMNATHTCEGAAVTTGLQATRSWVASIIKEKLKADPSYKPKDIVTDIKQEYGIQLNYFQAWRGKEIAKEQLQGSYKEAYKQLPLFCEKIMETNPGSLATFTTKDDSSFHRLFISFHATLHGFREGCRPLLFLDSIFLKSKYQGTLLAATAPDGDDGVFPVAFAVVDGDTDDNWNWFLVQLKTALSPAQSITFVADREKGLKESIAEVFGDTEVRHGYCIRYLSEQLMRDLKGQFSHEVKRLMVEDFYAAAYATRPEGFQRCIESIKNISIEAYNWIVRSEPVQWANAFFQGARYNHLMSNFGEMFYSWAAEAHDLPITQMVNSIRGKIMELIYTRRAESQQWMTRLTPSMEERLEKENLKARSLHVSMSTSSNKFEVRGESIEVVDVQNLDCSCKGWQLSGLPCSHAIAVINCLHRSPYDFCSKYLTADSYRQTYSESIHPVPNIDRPIPKKAAPGTSGALAISVTPPPTRRPPGRPTTKQLGSQESGKRQLQCSRCKSTGHNKSTCKEFMIEF